MNAKGLLWFSFSSRGSLSILEELKRLMSALGLYSSDSRITESRLALISCMATKIYI